MAWSLQASTSRTPSGTEAAFIFARSVAPGSGCHARPFCLFNEQTRAESPQRHTTIPTTRSLAARLLLGIARSMFFGSLLVLFIHMDQVLSCSVHTLFCSLFTPAIAHPKVQKLKAGLPRRAVEVSCEIVALAQWLAGSRRPSSPRAPLRCARCAAFSPIRVVASADSSAQGFLNKSWWGVKVGLFLAHFWALSSH